MSSSIFFRFKSQKDALPIAFDGTSLSVFEVKRDIISLSKLGDGTDFDLKIFPVDSNEGEYCHHISALRVHELTLVEYTDDTAQIPRSTTVIAHRRPAKAPGAGSAARYVTGKMPVNAFNPRRGGASASTAGKGMVAGEDSGKELTEEEKLQAILNSNEQTWKAEQQAASHKGPVRTYNKSAVPPNKPPPDSYWCHRCGEYGHWIQACPTNNDPSYDGRAKFKQVKGIPRSSLEKIETPYENGVDGKIDYSKLPPGAMYDLNNNWFIFKPDTAKWNKIQEEYTKAAENAKEKSAGADKEVQDRGLECPLHKGMFKEPIKTPCCGKSYCRDCIETALLDNDLLCPNCGKQVLLDSLEDDDETMKKVKEFEVEKAAQRKKEAAAKSPVATDTPKEDAKSPSAAIGSGASTPNSRKRSADGELPNDRKPSNPAVAKNRTNSNAGTPDPAKSSSNTPNPHPPRAPAADVAKEAMKQFEAQVSMATMQNMMAMNNSMGFNPNMGYNNMNMGMNPQMMGNMGINGMNMGNMQGYGGMNGMGMNGGWGGNQMGNQGWQGNGNYGRGGYGGGGRGGMQNGGGNGAYDRPPVRQYNRNRGGHQRR